MTKGENGDLGWARLGRQGGRRERGGWGCVSQTNLFYEKCRREGGVLSQRKCSFCSGDEEEMYAYTENLSLMISLLACTQTYKNNTALIST